MISCVVTAGQSPLSQPLVSRPALSSGSAEQWRAVIYPSALHVCLLQHGEYFPSQHFPKCLQKHSLPCHQQDGLPHGGFFYWRPLGFSNPKRNFYAFFSGSRVWGFLFVVVVVVMILLVSGFIPQKIPNKPGNSNHGVFGILLKNQSQEIQRLRLHLS